MIYTTNAIEALNAKLRRRCGPVATSPTDEAAMKLLYLVLNRSEKEWKMAPRGMVMPSSVRHHLRRTLHKSPPGLMFKPPPIQRNC